MNPIIKRVNASLAHRGIPKATFAWQLIPYMKRQGVVKEKGHPWRVQVHKWLQGPYEPRKEVLAAMEAWLEERE